MRINKYLAHAGIGSRRGVEELITKGLVSVNGEVASLGQDVSSTDQVMVNGKLISKPVELMYYLVNKPRGVVSTTSDPEGRRTVLSLIPGLKSRIYPVGRLDYESEGLMLLTNDGDLSYRLTHPKFEVEKTYLVQVKGKLSAKAVTLLEKGIKIEGKKTAPAKVVVTEARTDRTWFKITIHEGRNRQIRKMCEALDFPVMRLIRIKLGEWELGNLKPGEYKQIIL